MTDARTRDENAAQTEADQMRIAGEVLATMQRTTEAAIAMSRPLRFVPPVDQSACMAQMIASHALAECHGDLIRALAWCDLLHETVKIVAEIYSEIAPVRGAA